MGIPDLKGAYILVLSIPVRMRVKIGKLGDFSINPGLYAYVGSALGPGGLRARILRHIKRNKPVKWHIDYLTTNRNVTIQKIFLVISDRKLECELAEFLISLGGKVSIPKFGATDCNCPSHFIEINEGILSKITSEFKKVFPHSLIYSIDATFFLIQKKEATK